MSFRRTMVGNEPGVRGNLLDQTGRR